MPGKHYIIAFTALFLMWCTLLPAQQPLRQTDGVLPLEQVRQTMMPPMDNAALLAAEQSAQAPGRPPHFAQAIDVDIKPSTHGTWESLPDGDAVWRLRILSPDAYSINLGFSLFYMPEGGEMLIYDPGITQILGPFSAADNESHNQLWTPVLGGDELVIEVRLPEERRDELQLWLTGVNHDFLNFYGFSTGECHLDIICGESEGWPIVDLYRDIIQSVAVYGLGGETLCSGFLVNNTSQDCTPYFMTAYHCEVDENNAPSVVAYWNYQNSYCRQPGTVSSGNPGNGSLNNFNTGAVYRAGDYGKDFVLLEFDDPLPVSANAYFAGWSREASVPEDTMICIHHPDGAEKRISFAFTEAYVGAWGSGSSQVEDGNHIIVPQWSIGSTESGSSGSPLFDRNKRVVGQLHGGAASCTNNSYDSFGWFRSAWEGPSPSTRLSDWLDPLETGVFVMDGHWNNSCNINLEVESTVAQLCSPGHASYNITVGETFDSPVTLSVEGLPGSVSYSFDTNPVLPGGVSQLQLNIPAGVLPEGYIEFVIKASSNNNSLTTEASLLVVNQAPAQISLNYPADGSDGLPLSPEISWQAAPNAVSYDLQITTDSNFTNLDINIGDIGQDFFSGVVLDRHQTYYYRVRARNLCGIGPWSPTSRFRTAAARCVSSLPQDLPRNIPNNLQTAYISSFTEVPLQGTVASVRIKNLNIQHTFVGDLSAYLRSPSGTLLKLFDRPGYPLLPFGCPESDLQLSFSDNAAMDALTLEQSCSGSSPAISGSFVPLQALAGFIGEPAAGSWELLVVDNFYDDGGQVLNWELEICVTYPNEAQVFLPEGPLPACVNQPSESRMYVGTGFEDKVSLLLQDLPPNSIVSLDDYNVDPGTYVEIHLDSLSNVGEADFQLIASDGSFLHNCVVNVQVEDRPAQPILQQPVDETPLYENNILFRWSLGGQTDTFLLEVAADSLFQDILFAYYTVQNEYNFTQGLLQGLNYWRVSAYNDCGERQSTVASFVQQGTVSTTSTDTQPLLRLFPNPADDYLYVDLKTTDPVLARLAIYDSRGRLVHQSAFRRNATLNTAYWPAGLYLVSIQCGNQLFSRRVVIK